VVENDLELFLSLNRSLGRVYDIATNVITEWITCFSRLVCCQFTGSKVAHRPNYERNGKHRSIVIGFHLMLEHRIARKLT